MKEIIKFLVFPFIYLFSLFSFLLSNKTSNYGFISFRYIFVLTNGKSNDFANRVIQTFIPSYSIDNVDGVLGQLDKNSVKKITDEIEENGYYIFDQKLSNDSINGLVKFAKETPVSYLQFNEKMITYSKEKVIFDPENKNSPRFQFYIDELMKDKEIQSLVFDQSLLAVANSYLKTKPILDIVTMWWSLPFSAKASDRAAQKYHFDMDRFKFIKFFFYLTDVDESNGPHCYVKKSHKNIPSSLLFDRRIEDEEIRANYPSEDIVEIKGIKGSIIAVDTRGFHKGKILTEGKRLLFQLQFSNSLYGAAYNKVDNLKFTPEQQKRKKTFKRTYQLLK